MSLDKKNKRPVKEIRSTEKGSTHRPKARWLVFHVFCLFRFLVFRFFFLLFCSSLRKGGVHSDAEKLPKVTIDEPATKKGLVNGNGDGSKRAMSRFGGRFFNAVHNVHIFTYTFPAYRRAMKIAKGAHGEE